MSKKLKYLAINFLKFLLDLLGVSVQEREGVFNNIRNPKDRNWILLVRHGYGTKKWSLPGGGIKQAELATQATMREGKDETGFEVRPARQIAHLSFRYKYGFMILFESEIVGGAIRMTGNGKEIIECQYFHIDNLPDMYDAQRGMVGWAEWAYMHPEHGEPFYGHPDKPPIQKYCS